MAEYITDAELLALGMATNALGGLPLTTRDAARRAASDTAGSYLKKRFGLPLLSWGHDLRRHVAAIATYDLLATRGYNPASTYDDEIAKRYDAAILWLRDVAKGLAEPVEITDSTPTEEEHGPLMATGAQGIEESGGQWWDWGSDE